MQSLAVERFAQATIVTRGTPAGDPREMLGDRQLRHVRHDPRGQRDLAEGCRHLVLRVEPGERCACRGFPGVECRAPLLQVRVQFARVLRQVRWERDAMNLARGQGGVEFSHVLAGAHCKQVRFAAGFRCPQLVDQCRRQRQRRRAGREHVDAAREHGAGRRHAIEPRQLGSRDRAQAFEGFDLRPFERQCLELGHDRLRRRRPRAQLAERGLRRIEQCVFGIDRAGQRSRPPRPEAARE